MPLLRRLAVTLVLLSAWLAPSRAHAYAWMVKHGYTQCATCHADPAGGGLLNVYGRAQGEILMRTRYGSPPDHEPSRFAEPLFGAVPLPKGLDVSAQWRSAVLGVFPSGGDAQGRYIVMQADALGQYKLGRFRVNGSIGVVDEGANGAAITRGADAKLVSRVHWVGVDLGENEDITVRAGRMNLPFGLRSIEHTRFVRGETRTDTNAAQQYGLSLDIARGRFRGGAMVVLGNFAVSPDKFRSRGYAAYGEWAVTPTLAIGASSMITNTAFDAELLTPSFRHAHGVFGRYSPARSVVLSAEWDFLHTSQPTPGRTDFGGVGLLTVDVEPVQGLHFGPTTEVGMRDFDRPANVALWGSVWWFVLPHVDLRFDTIFQSRDIPVGRAEALSTIFQVHGYL